MSSSILAGSINFRVLPVFATLLQGLQYPGFTWVLGIQTWNKTSPHLDSPLNLSHTFWSCSRPHWLLAQPFLFFLSKIIVECFKSLRVMKLNVTVLGLFQLICQTMTVVWKKKEIHRIRDKLKSSHISN